MTNSPYSILGLEENSSKAEVKAAFKELSLTNDPDKNNNSEKSTKKFIEIRAAYEAIMDTLNSKKKADNFTSEEQNNEDNYAHDTSAYWDTYFSSKEFKNFKYKFYEGIKNPHLMNFKLETYTLLAEGEFFTTKAKVTYTLVRDCKSLEQIGLLPKSRKYVEKELDEFIVDKWLKLGEVLETLEPELDLVLKEHGLNFASLRDENIKKTEAQIAHQEIKHVLSIYAVYDDIMHYVEGVSFADIDANKLFNAVYVSNLGGSLMGEPAITESIKKNLTNAYLETTDVQKLSEIYSKQESINNYNKEHRLDGENLVAALKGAVASQDLDKFFAIAKDLYSSTISDNVGRYVEFNVIEQVLFEAQFSQVDETKLITMIQYLIEDKNLKSTNYSIKYAAEGHFFEVAQFLIDHGSVQSGLTSYNLFNYDGTKDNFEAFKWMSEHGAKVEKSIVAETICAEKIPFHSKALDNAENRELAKNFFVKENMSTSEEINDIEQGCNLYANFKTSYFFNGDQIIQSAIYSDKISNVKMLLAAGAKFSDAVFGPLTYAPKEMIEFVINQIDKDNLRPRDFSGFKMNEPKEEFIGKIINLGSVDLMRTVLEKGVPLYVTSHLRLKDASPEMAKFVLEQMRNHKLEEDIGHCTYKWDTGIQCPKYSYNLSDSQHCEVSKLVADYLGQTDQVNWDACQYNEL